jgi:hypothetical protein
MSQITPDHVEKLLQHWADEHARIWRLQEAWSESQVGGLAGQAVDRSREQGARTILPAGHGRARVARRLILKAMRDKGEKGRVPAWAGGDPMRCKATRKNGAPNWPLDSVAEQVDTWVVSLWRWDPRAAMCLQANYRMHMRTGDGARWVAEVTELPVSRHGYIAGLARGRLNIARCAEQQLQIAS